jgi:uncharacterized protein YecE (DUF72 family)
MAMGARSHLMNLLVGTSGYSYKEWKGKFYPRDIKPADMLRFYAEHFNTVEINNTFYRMPTKELVVSWTKDVPADFKFALKAPQRITHIRRLKDCADDLGNFLEVGAVLKNQLGPLLFQFPGNFKIDLLRLADFLKLLPRRHHVAFEFRNASWFTEEVFDALRKHNAALCIAESEETVEVPFEATADWGYLRPRRLDYSPADLKSRFARIQKQNWSDAYVFFKHEDQALGPKFAQNFLELAAR